nr:MAG TPA: HORMA domain [Caudoviricetes sp.]DAM13908.1 MAG TPA: HORMA domain [Caudoviricetes sp.]
MTASGLYRSVAVSIHKYSPEKAPVERWVFSFVIF